MTRLTGSFYCDRYQADATERACAVLPDDGWIITSGKRIPYRRHFHRGADRSLPYYARGLRDGRDVRVDGLTEADAVARLRRALGI